MKTLRTPNWNKYREHYLERLFTEYKDIYIHKFLKLADIKYISISTNWDMENEWPLDQVTVAIDICCLETIKRRYINCPVPQLRLIIDDL